MKTIEKSKKKIVNKVLSRWNYLPNAYPICDKRRIISAKKNGILIFYTYKIKV